MSKKKRVFYSMMSLILMTMVVFGILFLIEYNDDTEDEKFANAKLVFQNMEDNRYE